MNFMWECMLIAWKGLIGYLLWIIAFAIAGFLLAEMFNLIDKLIDKFALWSITNKRNGE